jgi:hypothetical protein
VPAIAGEIVKRVQPLLNIMRACGSLRAKPTVKGISIVALQLQLKPSKTFKLEIFKTVGLRVSHFLNIPSLQIR